MLYSYTRCQGKASEILFLQYLFSCSSFDHGLENHGFFSLSFFLQVSTTSQADLILSPGDNHASWKTEILTSTFLFRIFRLLICLYVGFLGKKKKVVLFSWIWQLSSELTLRIGIEGILTVVASTQIYRKNIFLKTRIEGNKCWHENC